MATKSQKIRKAKDMPEYLVKVGRREKSAKGKVGELVQVGAQLKEKISELRSQLDEINAEIIEAVVPVMAEEETGTVSLIVGDIKCEVKERGDVTITNVETLRKILGEILFKAIVRERVSYTPERKLVEMSQEDTDAGADIRQCLSVPDRKISVSYTDAV